MGWREEEGYSRNGRRGKEEKEKEGGRRGVGGGGRGGSFSVGKEGKGRGKVIEGCYYEVRNACHYDLICLGDLDIVSVLYHQPSPFGPRSGGGGGKGGGDGDV